MSAPSMANPFAAMFEGRTNDEVIELLSTDPGLLRFDPEFRLQLAMCWLKGPGAPAALASTHVDDDEHGHRG